jgi:hypothetical protein
MLLLYPGELYRLLGASSLLKTAVAMIERRAIPKTGSFVDIVLSCDNQEFHVLTIDSALRLETNAAFVATNDKRQTVDAHLASA